MKKRAFRPSKVETLIDDAASGRLRFPLEEACDGVPMGRLLSEMALWAKHSMRVSEELASVRAFVLEPAGDDPAQEREVDATCKALAEADLLRLPFDMVWVETGTSFGVHIGTQPARYGSVSDVPKLDSIKGACVGCLAADLATASGLNSVLARDYGGAAGIIAWPYIRNRSLQGRLTWYDLLHGIVLTDEGVAEKGMESADVFPMQMPSILRAVESGYQRQRNDWASLGAINPDLVDTGLSSLSVFLGTRLMATFMAAMNTSWVRKTECDPGNAVPMSARLSRKRRSASRRPARHLPYVLIDSFRTSLDRAGAGRGGTRKKMATHMRRGHVHRYWTGPRDGDRKLVSKFVQAMWINKADAGSAEPKDYRVRTKSPQQVD